MNNKLWQASTGNELHPIVEKYTVGNDQTLDQELLGFDITATIAHVNMLEKIEIITEEEASSIVQALDSLFKQWQDGSFVISSEHEDGHTAIELYLTEKLGQTGKKVHTGRSRNDQALVMMRLYLKASLNDTLKKLVGLDDSLKIKTQEIGGQEMPGYTHTQKAMPASVGMWLGAYQDAFRDLQSYVTATTQAIDQNPLGSAAGFGVDLPLDRDMTTKELGFQKTQKNPMYCGLSRGIFELMAVQALSPIMAFAGKFAEDMILFTSQEFSLFSLPVTMTTGSSIMPHKRNYDVFEIMRATAHAFPAHSMQLSAISTGTGSGYHRDLQLTKQITMTAFQQAVSTIEVLDLCISELIPNSENLKKAMTEELYTVAAINKLVAANVPFRDAYNQVKKQFLK